MTFLDLAKKRYSVRHYTSQKVEAEKLEQILAAAQAAPTACNKQPVHMLIIQDEKGLEKLSKAANIFCAPLAILICANSSKAWTRPHDGKKTTDIDASILTDHMMLEAADLGLGSVWICNFKPDVVREEFCLPDNLEPINLLAIGYTDETPKSPDRHAKMRKPISEMISYETM